MALVLNQKNIEQFNIDNRIARKSNVYNLHGKDAIWSKKAEEQEVIGILNSRKSCRHIVIAKGLYANSESEARTLQKIKDKAKLILKKFNSPDHMKANIAHMPEDAQDFFDLVRLDVTRRTLARADVVPFICNISNNADFTNPTDPQWLYEYVAPFNKFEGKGDKVNLVQIKTGDKDAIYFTFWGVGFEQDLYNMLFNEIFDPRRITDAVARGYVARKNDTIVKQILNFGYPTEKQQAAVSSGSVEQNYYDTLNNAIEVIQELKSPQTNREIDATSLTILCHSTDARVINRAINGNLRNGDEVKNLNPLTEINRIIPYNGDVLEYGNETLDFPGVTKGTCYLFVPQSGFWYLEKRGLNRKTGPGDVFSFTSDREAWNFVDATWSPQFFGGDTGGTATTKKQGYIVEVTLPSKLAT
jgi:hypothetical protein